MKTEHKIILSAKELQEELLDLIPRSKNLIFISAYVTNTAVDWLVKLLPKNATLTFVARLSPSDFVKGSSTISSIKKLINAGCKVKVLDGLHAKIYAVDELAIFVGSANFTNNGLSLFGEGNIEASIKLPYSDSFNQQIQNICNKSISINNEILDEMELLVDKFIKDKEDKIPLNWDIEIFKTDLELWTIDMLNETIEEPLVTNKKDKELLQINGNRFSQESVSSSLKNLKVYRWLISELKQKENLSMSFGKLSSRLQYAINDDPKVYRKSVKGYLENLISYCKFFSQKEILVTRPKHSEIIKLKE